MGGWSMTCSLLAYNNGRTYEGYGIDRVRGCVVVVRPDQHIAWVGELEGVKGLEEYFARFLVEPKVETRLY